MTHMNPEPRDSSTTATPILEIEDVSVVFRRGGWNTTALDHVSFRVREGEFLCIVGASGCGKTTLLRTINGLVPAANGVVRLHGKPARKADERMAMIFQQDCLLPWRTTLQNVRFGLDIRRGRHKENDARARECLNQVKLAGFEDYYPRELSGGMRQRANLARGLAVDPQILLMDEPFAALDAQTREAMQEELLQLWNRDRKTVVFITHQLDEAVLLGDRVIVMSAHPGRVREEIPIEIDRPRDLRTKRSPEFTGYVERIWELIEHEVRESLVEDTRN